LGRIQPRNGRPADRLKRPEGPLFRRDEKTFADLFRFGPADLSPGGDPAANEINVFFRELLFPRRHFSVADPLVQQTLVALPGHHGGAGIAALDDPAAQAEIQIAFEFLALAVTREAIRLEDRADVLFVEQRTCCRGLCLCRTLSRSEEHKRQCQPGSCFMVELLSRAHWGQPVEASQAASNCIVVEANWHCKGNTRKRGLSKEVRSCEMEFSREPPASATRVLSIFHDLGL